MSKPELTAPSAKGRLAGATAHPAVVHVGYERTATTTHQRQLFSRHKDIAYLGKPYPDPATWDLVYRFAGADSALFDVTATRAELETIVSEKVAPGERILTLSDEAILGPYCGDTRVLCQRLLGLFGDPKIVITIRRQDDLLISWLFHTIKKQYSRPIEFAFREMEAYFDNSTSLLHFLDYAPICRSFVELLGKENVLILPYELFRSDLANYAQTLSSFMGIEAGETHRLLSAAMVSNERLKDAGVAYFDFRARYFPSDLKTPRLDEALIRIFGWSGFNAGHVGAVVARIQAICAERFAQSNRRLADASGLDLQAYRYPGL
jgi:hypothetical protein